MKKNKLGKKAKQKKEEKSPPIVHLLQLWSRHNIGVEGDDEEVKKEKD